MKLTDFSALTFDCYGTLIDWETGIVRALRAFSEPHGKSPSDDELLSAFNRHENRLEEENPATLYPELLSRSLKAIGNDFGIEASEREAAAFGASVKDSPAFPDSAEALAYLKRHYKLVVVSNVDRESFKHSNAKLGVDFDLIITAQDVGSYKPALGHFHRAFEELAKIGVPKDKILHTAQSLSHDHVPAKSLGMTSIWINRRMCETGTVAIPAPTAATEVTPDWEVPGMAAMVALHKEHLVG